MKNKYHIENHGCDDGVTFDIELTDEEVKILIKVFEENNKKANYTCKPDIYIYKYSENIDSVFGYGSEKALNKSYNELKESEEK